jgi:tetratricopeptide (TPR) repeat protein
MSNLCLNRFDQAEAALQRASVRKLDSPEFDLLRYYLAFLKGNRRGMDEEIARSAGVPEAEDLLAHSEALVLARTGQLQHARGMVRRAVDLARQAGKDERAALFETGAAIWEALAGNVPAARQRALAALSLANGRDVEFGAAFALALAGDSSRPNALADDLDRRFPEDTSVRFSYLPVLRAMAELTRRRPQNAIDTLQVALPHELIVPGIRFFGFYGALYPAYVRGQALLAAHQPIQAAAEFQKILDHRGLVLADPIGALARLQLAKALDLSGDKIKATAVYMDFLTLWEKADPDVPILKQARAEYTRL